MHKAGTYLVSLLSPLLRNRKAIAARSISGTEAGLLKAALRDDARDYFYSSCVTLSSALVGITVNQYTWATVKLYYSVFYALRCELALNGICLFYANSSPFTLHASGGANPKIERESTHKTVLGAFEREFPSDTLLSQTIGLDSPLRWLMDRREEANYKIACFPDPIPPRHFEELEKRGLRPTLSAYIEDEGHLYTFDPDHAMLAYPIKVLESTSQAISAASLTLSNDEKAFLRRTAKDAAGPFTSLLSLLSG